MTDGLPIQYHLELYMTSTKNDPFFASKAETPYAAMSVGDWMLGEFDAPITLAAGSGFRIADIGHFIWTIPDSHIGHKLMVALNVEPRD